MINKKYIENADELASAVVLLAIKDYANALKNKNSSKIRELERFFYSDVFILYTSGELNAGSLLNEIKRQVNANNLTNLDRTKEHGFTTPKHRGIKNTT